MRCLWIPVLLLSVTAMAQTPGVTVGPIEMENSRTTASLRGVHAVGGGVVWASGTDGTVLRSEDEGIEWQNCVKPAGAEKLDFRGVWAWDANTAVVMSSGPGEQSRLYKTTDGCATWKLLLTNPEEEGFWDAIAFTDIDHGFLLGDPVKGRFFLRIVSSGDNIRYSPADPDPEAVPGTGAFAASNSALAIVPATDKEKALGADPSLVTVMFACGGSDSQAAAARVYRLGWRPTNKSPDAFTPYWTFSTVPVASSNGASGVFSFAFRDSQHGVAVGGNYKKPDAAEGTAAWSDDAGKRWTGSEKPPHGYRSAVAWDAHRHVWLTAGPDGSDYSRDDGRTWEPLENGNWNAISLPWFVGPNGRIGKLVSLPTARPKTN